ncbi:putative reverse transcriptase domain-containing protein [Tanacetum coccineum]|uniref:Reverse transcriptase domain-containing protein n=2 Tax=Tanacetum coccineum TaxID=301880 RepID=A0ABQ4WGA5_9ASTR
MTNGREMTPPSGFLTPPQIPNINTTERPHVTTTVFAATTPENTSFAYLASTLANPNPIISPAFVEANYKVLESLLREQRRKIRNEDLRTKLEYFSKDYVKEREMETRPGPTRETTPPLRPRSLGVRRQRERVVGFEESPKKEGSMPGRNAKGSFADSTGSVTPFVHWIEDYPLSDGLKMPSHIGSYDGKGDPDNFLHLFEWAIRMQKWLMPVASHMFTQQKKFTKTHLPVHNIKQRKGESTRAFATRYSDDTLQILGLHEDQRISGFVHGLRTRSLVEHLPTDLPSTYKGLMEKTYTWIEAREVATNGATSDQRENFERLKKSSWDNNRGQKGRDRNQERASKGLQKSMSKREKDKGTTPTEAPILMIRQGESYTRDNTSEDFIFEGTDIKEMDKRKDKTGQNQARDWKERKITSPTCQPLNQNFYEPNFCYNSNSSGFDQYQPPQSPDNHQFPQETSNEILQARDDLMEAIQAFLKEYDHIPPNEKCMALLLAEERFLKIKQAMEEEQNQPEVLQELLLKLINDLQILKGIQQEKKKPTAQSSIPYWNFSMIDDEEARDNFLKDVCTFLRKFSRIHFGITPKVILIAWESFGEIKDALMDKQYRQEDIQELMSKLLEDVRNINEEFSEYINCPSWNHPLFYFDDDDDEYTVIWRKPKAITPVLPIEEPDNSLSMGDEHLSTSVENLIPFPSEFEGISDDTCDVPVRDDSSTFDALNDHSEILSDSNNDDTSSDDDDFKDVEYVSLEEVNDDQEEKEIDLEYILQIQDIILREKLLNINRLISNIESLKDNPTPDCVLESPSSFPIPVTDSDSFFEESDTSLSHLDNSLPEFESFSDDTEETRSGSTTTHANNSLPEYDSFLFEVEPDQGGLTSVVISDNSNDFLLELPEFESFHFDPSFLRPPPEPPDVEICLHFEPDAPVINNFDELNEDEYFDPGGGEIDVSQNVEDDDSFTFIIRTFLPFLTYLADSPLLLSTGSEDTILTPVSPLRAGGISSGWNCHVQLNSGLTESISANLFAKRKEEQREGYEDIFRHIHGKEAEGRTDTKSENTKLSCKWKLYTDGDASSDSSSAGLMLIDPGGKEYTYDLRFRFEPTNNEAEYEALLAGLRIAQDMEITGDIVKEIHEGSCGFNAEPRSMVVRIMKQGYYWSSMHRDATKPKMLLPKMTGEEKKEATKRKESKEVASIEEAHYQNKLRKYHNERSNHSTYKIGDFVLLSQNDAGNPHVWQGPHMISEVREGELYKIIDASDHSLIQTTKGASLRKFYM